MKDISALSPEEAKRITDRMRTVLSYIDEERQRCAGLVAAIDDKGFLLYCITEAFCQPNEIEHFRKRYDEQDRPEKPEIDPEIEDLM